MATQTQDGALVHELIHKRRSGRAYDAVHEVSPADLEAVLEAARWAPSGGNVQPWRYLIGRKGDATFDQIYALLGDGNKVWAGNAPVLILTVYQAARVTSDGKLQPNRTAQHDLGMANISIAIEAVHRGMMTRMMGGFNRDAALKLIDAEANHYDVGPVIALGYPGDVAALSEELQQREQQPRTRKPVDELLLKLQIS